MGIRMAGQVYAVASGKGGVGKTTTVVNLGVVLRRANHSVALVDADLGMANLAALLGVDGDPTLHDVLAGESTVEEALVEEAKGFALLPGSRDLMEYPDADPRGLGDVLETLAGAYEFVLVDTGAGMSHEDVLPLGLADGVVLVTTPDPAAMGDTAKTAELAGLAGGDVLGLVVNQATQGTDGKHVAGEVGVELLGVVPFDPAVRESTASGRPLEGEAPDSPAAVAYRELAATLLGVPLSELTSAMPPAGGGGGSDTGGGTAASAGGDASAGSPEQAAAPADEPEPGNESEPADDAELSGERAGAGPSGAEAAGTDDARAADAAASTDASGDGGDGPDEEEDLDEYLEQFEDEPEESSGGLLARIGRLFR